MIFIGSRPGSSPSVTLGRVALVSPPIQIVDRGERPEIVEFYKLLFHLFDLITFILISISGWSGDPLHSVSFVWQEQ